MSGFGNNPWNKQGNQNMGGGYNQQQSMMGNAPGISYPTPRGGSQAGGFGQNNVQQPPNTLSAIAH